MSLAFQEVVVTFMGRHCPDVFVMRPQWGENTSSEKPPTLGVTGLLKCSLPAEGFVWVPQRAQLTITSMRSGFPHPDRHTGSPAGSILSPL